MNIIYFQKQIIFLKYIYILCKYKKITITN